MSRIGELNDRIIIKRETRTTDGMGGWTTTKNTLCSPWARVKVPASSDGVVAGADSEIRTHVVRVRQNVTTLGVQINDLITWRTYTLTVLTARPDGREWIDYDCKVYVP